MGGFSPYATQESESLVQHEASIYIALAIGLILYGIEIIAVTTCSYFLYKERKFRQNIKWFIYIYILFAGGTIFAGSNAYLGLHAWVLDRGYPGGPAEFWINDGSLPIYRVAISWCEINSLIVQALLMYRCYILYSQRWVLIIPALAYTALVVLCSLYVAQVVSPGDTLLAHGIANVAVPLFALEAVLNVLLCGLLIGRLFYVRSQIIKTLGSSYSKTYSDIAKLIAESALPCGIMSCLVAIFYLTNNEGVSSVLTVYVHIMCMSPMIIIIQVSRGRAWSRDAVTNAEFSKKRKMMGQRGQETSVLVFATQPQTQSSNDEVGSNANGSSEFKEPEFGGERRHLEGV